MAEGRRFKSLMNTTWFKSKRGGQAITPLKDMPYYIQRQELEDRN